MSNSCNRGGADAEVELADTQRSEVRARAIAEIQRMIWFRRANSECLDDPEPVDVSFDGSKFNVVGR